LVLQEIYQDQSQQEMASPILPRWFNEQPFGSLLALPLLANTAIATKLPKKLMSF
jgi:hypothetical protein